MLRGIPGSRHLCLEEGTLAEWLHEVLEPHVAENRLKSVLRSRGVCGAGQSVYAKREREYWLGELPEGPRAQAELLYEELDALEALRAKAEKRTLAEARKHREWRLLQTCPGLGPVRTAELLPVVVTPYRFQSRSNSGNTADWVW